MEVNIEDSWKRRLQPEFDKPYFYNLTNFVKEEYSKHTIYPPGKFIFHAFNTCPFDKVKVVIIGQDPYHEPGQYYGLCFSVLDGVPFPPSLLNIFKEIENDLGKPMPKSGRLERWADQGVLLINAILTVRAHQAGSHRGKGWEEFTDAVIKILNDEKENIVFMLFNISAVHSFSFRFAFCEIQPRFCLERYQTFRTQHRDSIYHLLIVLHLYFYYNDHIQPL